MATGTDIFALESLTGLREATIAVDALEGIVDDEGNTTPCWYVPPVPPL